MGKERAKLDFGSLEFGATEEKKRVPKPARTPEAKRELDRTSIQSGFTPRSGAKIDGRSLRSKGPREQLNMKVAKQLKDNFQIAAAERRLTNGELFQIIFEFWEKAQEPEK